MMTALKHLKLLSIGLNIGLCTALAACQAGSPLPEEQPAVKVPQEVCIKVEESLDKAKEQLGLEIRDGVTASLEQTSWLDLGDDARDALMTAIAVGATCTAPEPLAEVNVQVKNEYGVIMGSRLVNLRGSSEPFGGLGADGGTQIGF